MSKTFLITGVAGFLGSNLLDRAMADGHRVIGVDNLSMGLKSNIEEHLDNERFTFIERDITDAGVFDDVSADVDVITHLAAFKIPRYGKAIETLRINHDGTITVLDFAKKHKIKCVLASTSDVYGQSDDLPFSEERTKSVIGSSKSPRWAYAVSKLNDEHLALAYQDAYDFPVVLLRFFGSYGPKQPLSWWGGPPPVFIEAVLKDEVIPVHGDGLQTRSFTYVDDTVSGIYESMLREQANGEIINIGNNEEVTILDLAKKVKLASGTPGEVKIEMVPYESFSSKKYEDVRRRVPDTTLCKKLLGVSAEISLEEGLRRTIAWQKKAMNL